MNRKRSQQIIILLALAILIALFVYRQPPSPSPADSEPNVAANNPLTSLPKIHHQTNLLSAPAQGTATPQAAMNSQAQREQVKQEFEKERTLWQSPLIYFGKVVDENDAPIAGVSVSYGGNALTDMRVEIRNTGTVNTDNRGIFKIELARGVGLMIQLSHPNYYAHPDNSTGFDKRSLPRKGYFSDSEARAELFRMHKKGNPVPLASWRGGLHSPADGTIMDFPLRGKLREEIIGHLQVQGWKDNPEKAQRFDWRIKITLPGGGIQESTEVFDFTAPETGYEESVEINMGKDASSWQSQVGRKFFFKVRNHYAKGTVHMDIYHDLYFSMEYFVNTDGSTNLEPGPQKPPDGPLE